MEENTSQNYFKYKLAWRGGGGVILELEGRGSVRASAASDLTSSGCLVLLILPSWSRPEPPGEAATAARRAEVTSGGDLAVAGQELPAPYCGPRTPGPERTRRGCVRSPSPLGLDFFFSPRAPSVRNFLFNPFAFC